MTKQRDFKTRVRARMAKTGERYAAARAQLLSQRTDAATPPVAIPRGVIPGYSRFGGVQNGTAPLTNVLRHAGLRWAVTEAPYTEAVVNGLCGGPGFLYAVFEYKGWPPLLSIALHSRSMPDAYLWQGLGRLGVEVTTEESASPVAARRALEAVLAEDRPALCALGLRTVAVVGRTGENWWLDGRAPVPTEVSSERLARLRGGYKAAKHRLTRLGGPRPAAEPVAAIREAIGETARAYVDPPVPKAFQRNCGFRGLEKWQALLTDAKDTKGWPRLFAEGPRACAGLTRAYEWIACLAAPGAGRPFYADFLDSVAPVLDAPALREAADGFREAGRLWSSLATLVAASDPIVRRLCEATELDLERLDLEGDCGASEDPLELVRQRQTACADCTLSKEAARAVYAELASLLGQLVRTERSAVAAVEGAIGARAESAMGARKKSRPR